MVLLPLISIPLALLLLLLKKHHFSCGILLALVIIVIDFALKATNILPSDLEGFGVSNLILLISYIFTSVIITAIIILKKNLSKGMVFLVIFLLLAGLNFYFLGSYRMLQNSRSSGLIDIAIDNGRIGNIYKLNDRIVVLDKDTIEFKAVWSEHQRLIRNGIGNHRDTSFIDNHYIQFCIINPKSTIYKIYCTIGSDSYQTYGKYKCDERGLETYTIFNKSNLDNVDSLLFMIGTNKDFKKFIAVRVENKNCLEIKSL